MDRRVYYNLVSVSEAIELIEKYFKLEPLGVEEIYLENAYNRVLAEDIYSPIDYPPFDRSNVDGFAVRSNDTISANEYNPVKLRLKGYLEPGYKPELTIEKNETVEIATGAMIPRGVDSVVMIEYCEKRSGEVYVYKPAYPGENISFAGSDISRGDIVILRGTKITPEIISILAGLGLRKVKVYVKPKVAVYSIGNEIVEPGLELVDGKIYDSNGWLITTWLRNNGVEADYRGIIKDNYIELYNAIEKDLNRYDLIITSGGTSKGLSDIVYRVFNDIGEPGVIVHGLKIKPGKPTVISIARNKLLIGLPGFPLSCYTILHLIVKPIIYRLIGLIEKQNNIIKSRISFRIRKPLGITWFLPVVLLKNNNEYTAYPLTIESSSIYSIAWSDGLAIIPENTDTLLENTYVDVLLTNSLDKIPELNIIGSSDYLLTKILVSTGLNNYSRFLFTGSTGGWYAVKRGEADIAPTHLLDEETLIYNKPFIDKFDLRNKAVLIRGYIRLIGIIVEKNNPKNIKSIRDFLREDVYIVNRNKGSGTRVYLDYVLKKIAIEENIDFYNLISRINGYNYEVKTHSAVAIAIKQGRADAGIGLGVVAKIYDLDFIPLIWEEYDFLVKKTSLDKKFVKEFIEYLRDRDFMQKILDEYRDYYRLQSDTGFEITV
ncbi:MAG: molybdopterin biosynthesis protein [Desulfurococcaceae archaeon]